MKAREIRKLERARKHKEMKAYCKKIDRAFSRLSEGCSERVSRAISLAESSRTKCENSGSTCLPDVALYSAGYRQSNDITARA
ncbi:transcriptional regulator [Enterobacter bugandensis]|uniref:transcriptional antitermination N peptide n=1 Tax=Enterobacter bugandensis TaxID=881260 RepID=UPI002003695E|nr:transcriptional regulator [Enterobacter bugandensis]MCK6946308.1 transcriptional regulator [Enterobacter bugandensis]